MEEEHSSIRREREVQEEVVEEEEGPY